MLDSFNNICEFRLKKPGTRGNVLYSNDPEIITIKKDLLNIVNWLREQFQGYKDVNYSFEESKGMGYFPNVLHVSILPPEQIVSNGIYVVICFDIKGRGALIGCAESKTNPKGLNTINRSKDEKGLLIDVDGGRKTTKYNDVFVNPREFIFGQCTTEEIRKHLKESLDICLNHLGLAENSESSWYNATLIKENPEGIFDPQSMEDAREKIERFIFLRRGQKKFRNQLLFVYCQRCSITDCNVVETLEAAHIVPYQGKETNNPTNGLILRADIHTLFDLGLITINEVDFTVKVSDHLKESIYWSFHNKKIFLPLNKSFYPSKEALNFHNKYFQEKHVSHIQQNQYKRDHRHR